jgi:uncharacterized linocin/CFP29 family protein
MDFLKRDAAPIVDAAWKMIDEEASQVFEMKLGGRRVVDVVGPRGWEYACVPLGRIAISDAKAKAKDDGSVRWGLRAVLPLVELRAAFTLDTWQLDDVSRGAEDVDLDAVVEAAYKVASFEDRAIFHGLEGADMAGLIDGSSHDPIKLANEPEDWMEGFTEARVKLRGANVGGPYTLVLEPEVHAKMRSAGRSYQLFHALRGVLEGGSIVESDAVKGGALVSTRGGDYEMVLGQDLSIGFEGHEGGSVRLFITESFAFRVLEPAAAIALTL